MQNRNKIIGVMVTAAFIIGVVAAGALFYFLPIVPTMAEIQPQQAAHTSYTPAGSPDIAGIVEKAGPAVVRIETTVESGRGSGNPFFDDPFFQDFFGNRFDTSPRVSQGMGSGFIISKDGYILTNEHVVSGTTRIDVTMTGSEKAIPAKIIGSDKELDLAVLKIEGSKNLPTLEMGDTNSVRVGDWAIAIGNPYGLDHTVTVGVISAKGRPVAVQDRQYKDLLQTDASINPGNSGGPLLNMNGQVIGINTAVNASGQGIGFAIPTSTVKPVLDTLINNGKISRPWLGVYIQSMNEDIANYLKLDISKGAVVTSVIGGSPAQAAGIRQGDVIVELDHTKVESAGDLTSTVEKMKPGQSVMAVIYREGKKTYIDITIGEKGNTQ